jgi:hypothetical protein
VLVIALSFSRTHNCSMTCMEISYNEFHSNPSRNTESDARNSFAPLCKVRSSLSLLLRHSRLLPTTSCKALLYQMSWQIDKQSPTNGRDPHLRRSFSLRKERLVPQQFIPKSSICTLLSCSYSFSNSYNLILSCISYRSLVTNNVPLTPLFLLPEKCY